jgi:2-polyprenyl-6-methoxyphenol hydroxylase-like FAD-dependent oxidoreductase
MTSKTPVVIVGAGPCGLAMACGLWRRGIAARVLDASPEPGTGSRAIMLWPPVLDVLDELGVLSEAERLGYRPTALAYHTSRSRAVRLPLDPVHGPLVLTQDRTSRLLEAALERLGGLVERPVRVTAVANGGDAVRVTAEGPGGRLAIEADWLVGADGAHSTVRKQLGIEFAGMEYPVQFLLAEGLIDGGFERQVAHYYVTPAGVLVMIALPDGQVRISGALDDGTTPSIEAAQQLLDRRGPGGLRISRPSLLTTYTAPHRIAGTMYTGRCFLVGDAAHVHSPAGGQGLSLGMQDVRNLAWKLAGVIRGQFAPAILASYDTERRAAAQQVVAATQRMTRQTLFPPMAMRVRNAVLHLLDGTGLLRRILLPALSGRRIHYPDVLLGEPGTKPPRGNDRQPSPGTQAPAWAPRPEGKALDGFRLITAGPENGELAQRARSLVGTRPALVEHCHLAESTARFLVLRPDGYVAASGKAAAQLGRAWERLARVVCAPAPPPPDHPTTADPPDVDRRSRWID